MKKSYASTVCFNFLKISMQFEWEKSENSSIMIKDANIVTAYKNGMARRNNENAFIKMCQKLLKGVTVFYSSVLTFWD